MQYDCGFFGSYVTFDLFTQTSSLGEREAAERIPLTRSPDRQRRAELGGPVTLHVTVA